MSAKMAVSGVLLVLVLVILVFMVEMLVPLSLFSDFNELCRIALIRMEVAGGITEDIENDLLEGLSSFQLTRIMIDGTRSAKYGETITLKVTAYIEGNIMVSLFQRASNQQQVIYNKSSVSRRIIK